MAANDLKRVLADLRQQLLGSAVFLHPLANLLDHIPWHMHGVGLTLALKGQTPGSVFRTAGALTVGIPTAHIAAAQAGGHHGPYLP